MAENSGISWCDHTFNPWMGCTKVSPACKNCYAERDMDHRHGKVAWGPSGTRVLTSDQNWQKPVKWNRESELYKWGAERVGQPSRRPRVFCASLADVFEDWQGPIVGPHGNRIAVWPDGSQVAGIIGSEGPPFIPGGAKSHWMTMADVRARLFKLIDATPNLDWLLLTKRPENILKMWRGRFGRPNVWLGTSVESQEYANQRIPELLKCRDLSPVLFLSCEPLVGPIKFPPLWCRACSRFESQIVMREDSPCFRGQADTLAMLDWIIAGGESGPEARPNHPEWFRSLRDQAKAARVPFHFKQWGEWGPESTATPAQINNAAYTVCERGERLYRVGKKAAGRELDGIVHDAFPESKI